MVLHLKFHFRHVLACLHYNENLKRMTKKTKQGKIYTKVSYPKYKLVDEVVRDVTVQPTYIKCKCNKNQMERKSKVQQLYPEGI